MLERCLALIGEGGPILRLAPLRPRRVGLIQTRLPGMKESVLDKTRRDHRPAPGGAGCPPGASSGAARTETADLTAAIAALGDVDLLLIAGASAITDRRDVIPAADHGSGGEIIHFGMPVDPGNLLLLGRLGERPVLGLPGCARSPKVNGFDWVLRRLIADLPVGRARHHGHGRRRPVEGNPHPAAAAHAAGDRCRGAPRIAAIVMAAGRSSRMGGANKLLSEVAGQMLIARTLDGVLASRARPVVVVLGHEAAKTARG